MVNSLSRSPTDHVQQRVVLHHSINIPVEIPTTKHGRQRTIAFSGIVRRIIRDLRKGLTLRREYDDILEMTE